MISGTRERSLKIWDMKSGKHLRTFSEHYSSVMAVKLRRTEKWGDLVLTGSADETSLLAKIVYDCPTSRNGFDLKKIGLLEGHRGPVRSVDFLNDNTIVTAGLDRRIIIWKINPDSQHLQNGFRKMSDQRLKFRILSKKASLCEKNHFRCFWRSFWVVISV